MKVTVKTGKCIMCGESSELEVDAKGYRLWQGGMLIQRALPELPKDQRELLISGTHPKCWEQMMKEG